jgi:hypothetical protein
MGDSFWAKLGPNYNKYNKNLLKKCDEFNVGSHF